MPYGRAVRVENGLRNRAPAWGPASANIDPSIDPRPLTSQAYLRQNSSMQSRQARVSDASEVVRLAGVMFESMGLGLDQPGWPAVGERALRKRLGADMMAFVIDDPERQGRLVASAAGTIHRRLPRPGESEFSAGYVQGVATEESYRRKGLAEEVMVGLLGWFHDNGVIAVELHATGMAETLYRTMGFSDSGPRALRIRNLSDWWRGRVGGP